MSYEPEYHEVWKRFASDALKEICEMDELDFGREFGIDRVECDIGGPSAWSTSYKLEDYYYFQDNGADILFVAHLDTVVADDKRTARYIETDDGWVVHSGALDDRLGAYTGLHLLPSLGINVDVLLTVGEESGCSTAEYFDPNGKEYNWGIEFDRGGTDVVMYQYDDKETADLVRACGARVGHGSFSDIAYLEHLEVKCFNWGVGYHDYHGPRGYAYLDDYAMMVGQFMRFHEANREVYLPHEQKPRFSYGGYRGGSYIGGTTSYLNDHHNKRDSAYSWSPTGKELEKYDDETECDHCGWPAWGCDCDIVDAEVKATLLG